MAVLLSPALLIAHAKLVRSNPVSGATLTSPPVDLRLWFSERPEVALTKLDLLDSTGASISLAPPTAIDSNGVRAAINGRLGNGKYTLTWQTAASDGHQTSGTFSFTLAGVQAPAVMPALTAADSARVIVDTIHPHRTGANAPVSLNESTTFTTSMRWAKLIALLMCVGIITFRLAVIPPMKWNADAVAEVNDRSVRMMRALIVVFAIATLTRAFAHAELMPNSGGRWSALLDLVRVTRWGAGWMVGLTGTIIAFLGAAIAGRSFKGWIVAGLGVVAMTLGESLTGHAGALRLMALATSIDVAHVLGGGGWLGGLAATLLCGFPVLKRFEGAKAGDAASRLMKSYHSSAVDCVIIVVVTAAVAAWLRLDSLNQLWTTPYGSTLFRKSMFVLFALAFGFYHWRRFVVPAWTVDTKRAFLRTAMLELLCGVVIVAFTAILVAQPIP